jgi:hypothetical protein
MYETYLRSILVSAFRLEALIYNMYNIETDRDNHAPIQRSITVRLMKIRRLYNEWTTERHL